jgi:dihydroflavonol-4-reductase
MDGSSPAIPKIGFEIVDVRSVAEMLIMAMEKKEAAGQRFISAAGFMTIKDVAGILREAYPDKKIPKRMLPNAFARLIASFEKTLKPILVDLGSERRLDNSKAREILNWDPIPPREAVLACAESVVKLGIVK